MFRILAVARLTVLESSRKRVFVALLGFCAAMVVISMLFPSLDPRAQVILLQGWAYRLTLLFGMVAAVVLAAFSIPEDIEERRMQVLLAKPVGRMELLLGKFIGFLGVVAVFVAVMGLFSLALVRVAALRAGPAADEAMNPRVVLRASSFEAGPTAEAVRYLARAEEFRKVQGPLDRVLTWTFQGVTRDRFGPRVHGRLRARIGKTPDEPGQTGAVDAADLTLEIAHAAPPQSPDRLPLKLGYNRWKDFEFPVEAAGPGGTVTLRLVRAEPDAWVAGSAATLELVYDSGALGFEWNFLKSLFLVFMQVAIVLSLTLAVSLFVSAQVALLAGGFFFLCGSLIGFLRVALLASQNVVESAARGEQTHAGPAEFPPWMLEAANAVTGWVLAVVPDLSRLDYARFLSANESIPLGMVFGIVELIRYAAYIVGPLVVSCLIARRKEFV